MRKWLVGVLVAFVAVAAHAHTELAASVPADGAVLEAAPEQVELHFSAPVRLTALGLQKRAGEKRALGPLPSGASKDFAVAAVGLTSGEYVVTWRALAADTHVMTGELAFTVSGGTGHEGHGLQR